MLRFILMIALGVFSNLACARSLVLRQKTPTKQSVETASKKIIDSVVIRQKKNADFMFLTTILRRLPPNQTGDQQFERYVLNSDKKNYAGTYAIIKLNRSLKELMGKAQLTLRYVCSRVLRPQELHFELERCSVNDLHQIWIRFDPGLHILAWDVAIDDGQTTDHCSSMMWKSLFPNKAPGFDSKPASFNKK